MRFWNRKLECRITHFLRFIKFSVIQKYYAFLGGTSLYKFLADRNSENSRCDTSMAYSQNKHAIWADGFPWNMRYRPNSIYCSLPVRSAPMPRGWFWCWTGLISTWVMWAAMWNSAMDSAAPWAWRGSEGRAGNPNAAHDAVWFIVTSQISGMPINHE